MFTCFGVVWLILASEVYKVIIGIIGVGRHGLYKCVHQLRKLQWTGVTPSLGQ